MVRSSSSTKASPSASSSRGSFPPRDFLFKLLLFLNIVAVFAGLYYYYDQLYDTPLYFYLFVPDCPLYVFLAIPMLLKLVKNDAFSFLVAIGMAKYGLWTVFVLLFHWQAYFVPSLLWVSAAFVIGHMGMAAEGAALLPKKKVAASVALLALGWFLFNDIADYSWGLHPRIPLEGIELVAALTFAASIALTLAFYFYPEKIRKLPVVGFFGKIIGN